MNDSARGTRKLSKTDRDTLVVENLPLVGYLVSEVWGRATHLSRDDLASAGAVALITSAEAFDPDLGVPFGAFARRRIIGAFADEMRSLDWAPRTARRRIKEAVGVQEQLTAVLGRVPSLDEIASTMGVDRATASLALSDAARTVTQMDDATSDMLAADIALPEETLLASERLAYLRAAIDALPAKMRGVIEQVYFDDRSVKEIAEELGITHSAVSQLRSEGIRLIRDGLNTHYAEEPAAVYVPESRVSAANRGAYLSRMAQSAVAVVPHLRVNVAF